MSAEEAALEEHNLKLVDEAMNLLQRALRNIKKPENVAKVYKEVRKAHHVMVRRAPTLGEVEPLSQEELQTLYCEVDREKALLASSSTGDEEATEVRETVSAVVASVHTSERQDGDKDKDAEGKRKRGQRGPGKEKKLSYDNLMVYFLIHIT